MKKSVICISLIIIFLLSFPIFAFGLEASKIEITRFPDNTMCYIGGKTPDFSKMQIKVINEYNSYYIVNVKPSMIKGFDSKSEGIKTVWVEYNGLKSENFNILMLKNFSPASKMADVPEKFWGRNAVAKCLMAGFLNGYDPYLFGTNDNMTRGQFATLIYNIYKNDSDVFDAQNEVNFKDIAKSKYYYNPVIACAKAGIINGITGEKFAPNANITRQECATIICRVLLKKQIIDKSNTTNAISTLKKSIKDFDKINNYAINSMALTYKIAFNGDDKGFIHPKNNITRCESAQVFYNLLIKGKKSNKLVYLSPSNQMHNKYFTGNTTEGEQMIKVATKTKPILENAGYDVILPDIDKPIKERSKEANDMGALAYVAIHSNAISGNNNGSSNGPIVFYNGKNKGAKSLAQNLYNNVSAITMTKGAGIKDDILTDKPFAEIRIPSMANCLIEVEYHDYSKGATWIINNISKLGDAIARAIISYVG